MHFLTMPRSKGSNKRLKTKAPEPSEKQEIGGIRHSLDHSLGLIFCGFASYLIFTGLSNVPLPALKALEKEVLPHIVQLPIGLVLLGLALTATVTLVSGSKLDVLIRGFVADPIATLAAHLVCLWYGAIFAAKVISAITLLSPETVRDMFCSFTSQFTVVAIMQVASMVSAGLFESRLKQGGPSFFAALASIAALVLIGRSFLSQSGDLRLGELIACGPLTVGLGLACMFTWLLCRAGLELESETSSQATLAVEDSILVPLSAGITDAFAVASAFFKPRYTNISIALDTDGVYQVSDQKLNRALGTIQRITGGKVPRWTLKVKALDDLAIQVQFELLQAKKGAKHELRTTTAYSLSGKFFKRLWQEIRVPVGAYPVILAEAIIKQSNAKPTRVQP